MDILKPYQCRQIRLDGAGRLLFPYGKSLLEDAAAIPVVTGREQMPVEPSRS